MKITEEHVQQAVTQFLELDGWRAIRTDPVSDRKRGKGFGEEGMPDYLYVRYSWRAALHEGPTDHALAHACVMWIEFKAPGKKAKTHQLEWHKAEKANGALVLVVDSFNQFALWYHTSGLRKKVTAA